MTKESSTRSGKPLTFSTTSPSNSNYKSLVYLNSSSLTQPAASLPPPPPSQSASTSSSNDRTANINKIEIKYPQHVERVSDQESSDKFRSQSTRVRVGSSKDTRTTQQPEDFLSSSSSSSSSSSTSSSVRKTIKLSFFCFVFCFLFGCCAA